jgi:membrane-associated phospholipid phosphatase
MEIAPFAAHRNPLVRRGLSIARPLLAAWRRPQERRFAIALAVAAFSALAFARVTEDYLTNDPLARWDLSFARWLADHRSAIGVDIFRAITDFGSPAVSVVLAAFVCVLLFRRRQLSAAALLPVVLGGAELLNLALKLSFHRARPEVASVHLDTYSYPSGHAMIAVATYGAFAYLFWNRRSHWLIAAATVVIVGLIGFSRLYLGVHYLSDVLGGLTAGTAWLATAIALHIRYGDLLARRLTRS